MKNTYLVDNERCIMNEATGKSNTILDVHKLKIIQTMVNLIKIKSIQMETIVQVQFFTQQMLINVQIFSDGITVINMWDKKYDFTLYNHKKSDIKAYSNLLKIDQGQENVIIHCVMNVKNI